MRLIALVEVDEKVLKETGHSFEDEMGWVAQSGVRLLDSREISEENYEYAAFAWNRETGGYEQMGRSVSNELLAKNRFKEYAEKGYFHPRYDTEKVIFKRREVTEFYGIWEVIG